MPKPEPSKTTEEFRAEIGRWDEELAAFAPRVTLKRLKQWRETAKNIAKSATTESAATRYESVDREFSEVEELVSEALAEFEREVDLELARRRGN